MTINRKWLWIGGAAAGAAAALALGVPLATLLLVAAVLACPAMMLFGMRGMHHGASAQHGPDGMASPPGFSRHQPISPSLGMDQQKRKLLEDHEEPAVIWGRMLLSALRSRSLSGPASSGRSACGQSCRPG